MAPVHTRCFWCRLFGRARARALLLLLLWCCGSYLFAKYSVRERAAVL